MNSGARSAPSRSPQKLVLALSLSGFVHGALGFGLGVLGGGASVPTPRGSVSARFTGTTFEIHELEAPSDGAAAAVEDRLLAASNRVAATGAAPGAEDASDPEAPAAPVAPPRKKVPRSSHEKPTSGAPSAAVGTSSGAPGASGGGAEPSSAVGGNYGAADGEARRGSFPDAFTRALPAAAQSLGGLAGIGFGEFARAWLRVEVDDEGRIVELVAEKEVPPEFFKLLRSAKLLLRRGTFMLPPGSTGSFSVGLIVRVEAGPAEEATESDEEAGRPKVSQLSSQYPRGAVPGVAFVRYASGRTILMEVYAQPNRRDFP